MSILIEGLTKRYGDNVVVSDATLEVSDGELFVLLGGSGSGKSTILRMIAGLITPDSGRVELNGRDVTSLPPQARNTGFVFQNYSVFRHMTVADNVAFGLRIRKVAAAEKKRRVGELLELVGLTGLGGRFPNQLSGGQLQRVALARALAYDPAVLLLDEPFSALDVKIRSQLRQSLKEIQRTLKVTTILVTHDQEEAFELADRVGVMDRGLLIEVGSPEKLYHFPKTEFAAAFIGGGNVLVGRAEKGQIQLGQVNFPFPVGAPTHEDGIPVRILFRPETVLLNEKPFEPDDGVISLGEAEVTDRVFVGSLQRVRLALEGLRGARPLAPFPWYGQSRTPLHSAQLTTPSGVQLSPGQRVWVGIRNFHVLEPSGLKVMIYADHTEASEGALSFGSVLAKAARGPVTLFGLAENNTSVEAQWARVQGLKRQWFADYPRVDLHVRQGDPSEQVVLEALQGHYELVVMPHLAGEPNPIASHLIQDFGLPVMLVPKAPSQQLERILICTAGGEPGKSDVQFGGRIARRARANTTLFHVQPEGTDSEVRVRTQKHMQKGQQMLSALGLLSEIKVETQLPVVEGVMAEAHRGKYDLVVIGAPAPRLPQKLFWTDFATPIASGIACPLLIVPMTE